MLRGGRSLRGRGNPAVPQCLEVPDEEPVGLADTPVQPRTGHRAGRSSQGARQLGTIQIDAADERPIRPAGRSSTASAAVDPGVDGPCRTPDAGLGRHSKREVADVDRVVGEPSDPWTVFSRRTSPLSIGMAASKLRTQVGSSQARRPSYAKALVTCAIRAQAVSAASCRTVIRDHATMTYTAPSGASARHRTDGRAYSAHRVLVDRHGHTPRRIGDSSACRFSIVKAQHLHVRRSTSPATTPSPCDASIGPSTIAVGTPAVTAGTEEYVQGRRPRRDGRSGRRSRTPTHGPSSPSHRRTRSPARAHPSYEFGTMKRRDARIAVGGVEAGGGSAAARRARGGLRRGRTGGSGRCVAFIRSC